MIARRLRFPCHRLLSVWLLLQAARLVASDPAGEESLEYRGEAVVHYRAWRQGGHLVLEARHEPPWHTYAMDNVERARERSGREHPETELPTRIELSGALAVAGDWMQSEPIELSQPNLRWYTWGFEGTSYFAVPIERRDEGLATVRINGQACTAELCAMIDDLELRLQIDAPPPEGAIVVELATLVPLRDAASTPSGRGSGPSGDICALSSVLSGKRFPNYSPPDSEPEPSPPPKNGLVPEPSSSSELV